MDYVIMADGQGKRWDHSFGRSKYCMEFDGESLLARTVRLVHQQDADAHIVITTHDASVQVQGAMIHQPVSNQYEIDRFTVELLKPDICYLYGDTYYTESAIHSIVSCPAEGIIFFGNQQKLFAVKIHDAERFRQHFDAVKRLYLEHRIQEAIGWEIYHSIAGLPLESRQIGSGFLLIDDGTTDFNTCEDYESFLRTYHQKASDQ